MFANRFTVVTDACVLVSPLVRNLLLSLAEAHLYRVRWSGRILDEFERGFVRDVLRHKLDDPEGAARKARGDMERAFPEAMVEGHEHLEAALNDIPDPEDCHVVAAALHASAAQIITNNLRDFPAEVMKQLQIDVRTADDFIADTLDLPMDSSTALSAVHRLRKRLKRPELTPAEMLIRMERNGLGQTAALLAGRMELW
ncbi:MAG: PIN domain-containing protein [Burkholderiaceae bacterium]|nr:PIN domain-containing protein [Burkholderiaceae bacterium]